MSKYLLVFLLLTMTPAMAEDVISDDVRQVVNMPAEMREDFLKNMRGHMESLDHIIAALADSDFSRAADIAETKLGAGQGKKKQCEDEGEHTQQKHQHSPVKNSKKGFGQFMPQEMKKMGMQLHHAANEFANIARKGDAGDAYKSLRNISAACVACHFSFQVTLPPEMSDPLPRV